MDRRKETIDAFDKLASLYQERFMDFDLYNDSYDQFCKLVEKKNAKIFEAGCGPGNITKYILSKRPDFKVEATDLSPNMIELAKANNPTAKFRLMDCRDIGQLDEKFDGIICGFCIPYLSKEETLSFIGDSYTVLNENGILYFSTIEGDYKSSRYETSSNGQARAFVYYHEEAYLLKGLQDAGFEVVDMIRKQYGKSPGVVNTHLIFLGRKRK